MQTDFIKLYVETNEMLVRSMEIKLIRNVAIVNDYIRLMHGELSVDKYHPNSWKYYMNLAGSYHPTDTLMEITSLDTLEKIIFSRENLLVHPATMEAYTYDSRYMYALLKRYPEQEQLILGIIYPADINKAIAAPEGTILRYKSHLIEPQEITLINDLEIFIKGYIERWDVQAFGVTDTLYNVAQYGVMTLAILPKLLNLRLLRCKTPEAHSFHIREYLASHGRLDRYLPYMTLKQALFLYRNMLYIERNAGKVDQFKVLIDKLLTDRYIPLGDISIRQLNVFDPYYYNTIQARRKALNTQYNVPEIDTYPITKLYKKEIPLAVGNELFYEANDFNITHTLKTSASSVLQTKDLESSMIDYSDAIPDPLETVILREWGSLAIHDLYTAVVTFKDPKSSETSSLYAKDAFIYMWYVFLKALNVPIIELPPYVNSKSRKLTKPTVNEMLSVVDVARFSDLTKLATDTLADQPVFGKYTSTKSFYSVASKIFEQTYKHWFITSNTEHMYKRGLVENLFLTLYVDELIEFPKETKDMNTWLLDHDLPVYNYTYEEAQKLILEIFTEATGYNTDPTKMLKNIQKAMTEVMLQLSSYSIQIIREINLSKIRPLNWPATRIGDIYNEISSTYPIDVRVDVLGYDTATAGHFYIEAGSTEKDIRVAWTTVKDYIYINNLVDFKSIASNYQEFSLVIPGFITSVHYDRYTDTVSNKAKFIFWEYYLELTPAQQSSIKSIY